MVNVVLSANNSQLDFQVVFVIQSVVPNKMHITFNETYCLFEIRKIAVCFFWLSLPGDCRVTDEALLAETT